MPLVIGESRMVRPRAHTFALQPRRERVYLLARRAVDDAGLAAMTRQYFLDLRLQVGAREHAIRKVRSIERSDQLDRILQRELRRDVAADARRRRGGERVQADARQQRAQPSELPVLRTEIVAPLADAMGFVDGDEADVQPGQQPHESVAALTGE